MKKLLPILLAIGAAALLSGCKIDTDLAMDRMDSLADWLLSLNDTVLNEPLSVDEIQQDLPEGLTAVTIDDTTLPCEVTHIAIRSRDTNSTRQTDTVVCEVVVEGSGIYAHYLVDLYYTYTSSNGWGLDRWELETSNMELEVTDTALTDALFVSSRDSLQSTYGAENVSYRTSVWDSNTLTCSEIFDINAASGTLVTTGFVQVNAVLNLNTEEGLHYTWSVSTDSSQLIHGADLTGTTWFCSGKADIDEARIAVRVEDFDIENGTATVSAVASVVPYGSYYAETTTVDSTVVNWTNGTGNQVTFSLALNGRTWDCCFDSDNAFVRLDGSYINTLTRKEDGTSLTALIEQDEGMTADDSYALGYSSTTSGYTYPASDGTIVYSLQIEYPLFSGDYATTLNNLMNSEMQSFLASPSMSTGQSYLDSLETQYNNLGKTLPLQDDLTISVRYSSNGYLSLLWEYSYTTGNKNYQSAVYELDTMDTLELSDVFRGSDSDLGSVLNIYLGSNARYSDATVLNYMEAWVLTKEGVTFYILRSASDGTCDTVTIPYSNELCILDPSTSSESVGN